MSFLACWLPGMAVADLVMEVPVIELQAKPEDESVSTTFVFYNKGTKPVKVLSIDSACSCLSASLDKAVYEPGEKGTGKAEFKVSSFVGRHEKTVHVQTDDPAQSEWVVSFVLDVPEVIKIEPKTLQWWLGDEATAKTTKVTMTGDKPMVIKGITATRENVEFSWKEITPGREYEVTVKPKTTGEVMLGALRIETDSSIPKYQRQLAFFSVYRKPSTQEP
ncbi:MAG: DUF1573 domain-containing protein [Prosthecobacter sp.]|nr:DUF1573 domain-containing protein [Prosthecobacter sp.]